MPGTPMNRSTGASVAERPDDGAGALRRDALDGRCSAVAAAQQCKSSTAARIMMSRFSNLKSS